MTDGAPSQRTVPEEDLERLLAETESGVRTASGFSGKLLIFIPLSWSLFQLWYSSDLPFMLNFGVFNDTEARSIHLAFAMVLALAAYPAFKGSPKGHVPIFDWALALVGGFSALYICLFSEGLAGRAGAPTTVDLVVAVTGMVLLLEATRRALGPPLMIIAIIFLGYTFFGPYMPEVIAHKGQSLSKVMSHQWLTTEGVFGIALGVSTSFVFLFVLFGALLDKAGAGNYFIKVAFSLLGHLRGGPAKAAVVASGLTGLISGSSIANVVTTGTFTIPLMKRVGFPAHKAGAIEVAASINGQVTPPIMGAAAFLMVEYVGVSYIEVIKHAALPALISYIALVYIVHLEALKANMTGLPREHTSTFAETLLGFVGTFLGLVLLGGAIYYGVGWIKDLTPTFAIWIICAVLMVAYLGLMRFAVNYPELEMDDPNAPIFTVPRTGPTIKSGLHYVLPIVVLLWCLVVERFSPGKSAFWATVFMVFIVLTQRPLMAFFRGRSENRTLGSEDIKRFSREGVSELMHGLISGANNMVGIGVATAAAGIIVGTVTLTGVGLVMTEFVEYVSGGNVLLMLVMTAFISLILGMGLPTTANYMVVSSLMAPVIVTLGAESGLIVPLIAVHMFVFYFGILADSTPPVGLAAFAGSAIARSDPMRTGVQGFLYNIRTAVLPFMFIFNTQLLLIDIGSVGELILVIVSATVAMLIFAASTQGYWLSKSRLWESVALLLVAFALFRPGFFMDYVYPPYDTLAGKHLYQVAESLPKNGKLRFYVDGTNLDGDKVSRLVLLPLGDSLDSGKVRLRQVGLELSRRGDDMVVDLVEYDSVAQNVGIDFDWRITDVEKESVRPAKQWVFLPAFLLLMFIGLIQRERQSKLSDQVSV